MPKRDISEMQPFLKNILDSGLFKRTFVYTFSASLNALVAFLLLPVLTTYLSPYDYGIVETFMAVTACLTGIVLVGGQTVLAKEYFNVDGTERNNLIGNILGMTLFSTLVLFLIFSLISSLNHFLSNLLKLSHVVVLMAIIVSFASAINSLLATLFQLEKKSKTYALFMNSKSLFEIIISLFLIIVIGLKWEGRIAGILGSYLLFLFLAFILFQKREMKIKLPIQYGKKILTLGLPMIVAHITVWVYGMVDKLMINNLVNIESTGLYSVGYRFGMVVNMVETAFSLAWLPFFLRI